MSILCGLIVIQARGKRVNEEEVATNCPCYKEMYRLGRKADMDRIRQFVLLPDGTIRLADYGNTETIRELHKSLADRLACTKRGVALFA